MTDSLLRVSAALADRYRIERELGRGGMATVWLARDLKYDRLVAVKMLHPELGAALGSDRFLREIQVTARLQHPHILPVFDSGEVADDWDRAPPLLWFTMPYVEGESLRQRLSREGPLSLAEALRIAEEVAEALDYAHSQGIIHRDIKPENILLSRSHALVADFGIAKPLASSREGLTGAGLAIGTPAYMSPEQATGGANVDGRADLYSLGCVFYEMLTGVAPFAGLSHYEILAQQLADPVPLVSRLRSNVPPEVDQLLNRVLAPTVADRIATAAELAEAFRELKELPLEGAPPARSAPRHRAFKRAALLALGIPVLLGGGALLFFNFHRGPMPSGPPTLVVLPFDNLGPEEERYFVDGITEEITSRLGSIADLRVIAKNSASHYRKTDKSLRQIGQELGAQYAVEGAVRWERAAGSAGRVRVNARLIRMADGSQLWSEGYDAVLAGIFQLQSEIAEKISQGLHLSLLEPERKRLTASPTANLQAYDYLLQGKRYLEGWVERDLRLAAQMFEKAVDLDPGFAVAHAALARAHAKLYWHDYDRTPARLAKARDAAKRAVSLAPELAESHLAMGYYHYWGSLEYDRALREFAIAGQGDPNNSELFQAIASVERRRGRFASSAAHQERAVELDPRSMEKAEGLAVTYYYMRRYADAEREINRAIALGPDQYQLHGMKILIYLSWRKDISTAMEVLREATEGIPVQELVDQLLPYFGVSFFQILDSALTPNYRRAVEQVSKEPFGSDSAWYFQVRAAWAQHRGIRSQARAYYDSTRTVLEAELRADSGNARAHSGLGLAYAGLGQSEAAVREGKLGTSLLPFSREAITAVDLIETLAQIYLMVGQSEQAMDQIEVLLALPGPISPAWLTIDPRWKSLKGNPRFQRLIAREPTVILADPSDDSGIPLPVSGSPP